MAEGKLPHISGAGEAGRLLPAADDALAGVADGVGVVCDRRQRRQAQHLRLPRPRHHHLPAGPRHGRRARRRSSSSTTSPISKPKVNSIRGGTSFWVTAGKAGVRSDMLTVPVTFPPEDVDNGELLSGLPLPDIRGTMGTFSYYATDLSRYEEGNTEMGGILKRLVFDGDTATDRARGAAEPDRPAADRSDPPQGADAERRRQDAARRAAGRAGRAHPVHDPRGTAPASAPTVDDRRPAPSRSSPASGRRGSISPSR